MLDYKIKELKRDIGPRGATIEKLKEQTNKMQQEQTHFKRVFHNLCLIVEDLRMRMRGLISEHKDLRQVLEKQEEDKKQFKDQVHDALNNIGEYKKLKKSIIKLYKLYVTEEEKNRKQDDTDGTLEFQKIRKNLQNNVKHLREAQTKANESHEEVNKRLMKQNVDLVSDINLLKQELHTYKKNTKLIASKKQMAEEQAWMEATEEQRLYNYQEQEIMALQQ